MATRVKIMPENPHKRGYSKYPWPLWFDGSPWRLVYEEDFPNLASVGSFVSTVQQAAKRYGGKVQTCCPNGRASGEVYIMFVPSEKE